MIVFHPRALAEMERARDWYEERWPRLGDELVDEIEGTLGFIEEMPTSFGRAAESKSARRAILPRFPYSVVFEILDEKTVLIVALAHAKRRPGYWRRRTKA